MDKQLSQAIHLRNIGSLKESNQMFMQLVKTHPNDANIQYQCAWSLDVLGEEAEAVPYYERAIELGLPDEDLAGAYLGLGSTYRTLGAYEQSRQIFEKALAVFPENNAIACFYAMTLYNLQEYERAMGILLKALADTSSDRHIHDYKKAIVYYSDKLHKVWR
ncbi:tetratricopeptide (TPR) repeat protein [Cytobacillus horneckiae]|nr:tetratricopeptide repeat protein [Cytobacillus horneckiae]MBN6886331.1 tetratricopeptide repeat protein [Cytobacillus horneckiae]MEC1159098.1 tetratricopeptide repeat protein [Cytobacillus horneckiae]MED2938790.1 tetratricopeptide repeat protein [Cytobacillus horneckiae]